MNLKGYFAWEPGNKTVHRVRAGLHSAKGGAVETGCSDLYGVMY